MNVKRFISPLLFVVVAGALSACGTSNYSDADLPAASGRFAAITSAYPGVVMVIAPEGRSICTGVIVSERAVMTAAHCLLNAGTYTVRTAAGAFTTASRFVNGPGDVNDTRDVGLLIFSQNITQKNSDIVSVGNQVAEGDAVTIVGFGCSDITTRSGTGVKREGSNVIAEKNADYLVLLTPKSSVGASAQGSRGIMGDSAQAGTCFGDSGGPLLKSLDGQLKVVGVTHAGGTSSSYYFSEFVNVADNESNRSFLRTLNAQQSLNIAGL